jgi:hypothetical protein
MTWAKAQTIVSPKSVINSTKTLRFPTENSIDQATYFSRIE